VPRVALAGCGAVGDAFALALSRYAAPTATLTRVLVRSPDLARPGLHALTAAGRTAPDAITRDAGALLTGDPEVLVEALGGLEPARTLVTRALRRGMRVITVNKELIARHGPELLALATQHGTSIDFEGAVCAGVPIVRVLRARTLPAPIARIEAILNGTTNVLLDAVARGEPLRDAITAAQAAGYAEADPTRDLDGRDAEAKLRIVVQDAAGGVLTLCGDGAGGPATARAILTDLHT